MPAILGFILPALVPMLTDGFRGLFAKFTGGAGGVPQNMAERLELMKAENARLSALAELDRPIGEPSRWVVDMRASFRYLAIAFIWLATVAAVLLDAPAVYTLVLLDMSGASLSFILGERFYLKLKG